MCRRWRANPLTPDELAMFAIFECEGWPQEERRAHVVRKLELLRRNTTAE